MHTLPCTTSPPHRRVYTSPIRVMKLSMREATRREARRGNETRRDGPPRSSANMSLRAFCAPNQIRGGFAGISGTQMSAGTLARAQWKRNIGDATGPRWIRQGPSINVIPNDIKPAEFLAVRECSICVIKVLWYLANSQLYTRGPYGAKS